MKKKVKRTLLLHTCFLIATILYFTYSKQREKAHELAQKVFFAQSQYSFYHQRKESLQRELDNFLTHSSFMQEKNARLDLAMAQTNEQIYFLE